MGLTTLRIANATFAEAIQTLGLQFGEVGARGPRDDTFRVRMRRARNVAQRFFMYPALKVAARTTTASAHLGLNTHAQISLSPIHLMAERANRN